MLINKFEFIKSILNDTIKTGMPIIENSDDIILLKFESSSKRIYTIYEIDKKFFDKYLKNLFLK